jgi:hypothetical protein
MRTRALWRVLFVLSALYFVARGPWRAIRDSGDFLVVFSAARCWLHGDNPYSAGDLAVNARAAGVDVGEAYFADHPSLYPPPALAILAPFALLPWTIAKVMWIAALFGLSWWSIVTFAEGAQEWALPVACFLFIFAHLHTGISLGQPSVLVCGLIFLSLFTQQPLAAGLLLGIAVTLKPQLGIGFLLLAAAQRQYRKVVAACALGLVVTGIALMLASPGSLHDLMSNLSQTSAPSSPNSSSPLNPSRYQLINVATLIPAPLYRPPIVIGISGIILLITVIAVARTPDRRIAVALVASATVLVVYHHYYDAEILWLNIPAMLSMAQKRISRFLWVLYAVFLVPGQTIAAQWFGLRPDNGWSWLLLNHETIAIVLVWTTFVWISTRQADWGFRKYREPFHFLPETILRPQANRLLCGIIPAAFYGSPIESRVATQTNRQRMTSP